MSYMRDADGVRLDSLHVNAGLPTRRPALRGVPLCTGFRATGNTAALASSQTSQVTTKWSGVAGFDATDLRVVFSNFRTNQYNEGTKPYEDVVPEADQTLKAGLVINGVTYELTFRGSRSITINPGGWAESDPLPIEVAAGDIIRTVTYQAAGTWRVYSSMTVSPAGDGAGVTVVGDYTADDSTQLSDGGGSGVVPAIVTATPKNPLQRTVFISGASDAEGVGDGYMQNSFQMCVATPRAGSWGFITRALKGNTGAVQTARTGDRCDKFILPAGHKRRLIYASSCSDVVTTFGINDLNNSRTLAQLKADKITEWLMYQRKGCRTWQTTLTPFNTSTDNWKTTTNQTVTAWEASRTAFNDWIRDGAPLNYPAMTAAATGISPGAGIIRAGTRSSGVHVKGDSRHPLYGYFEIADLAESARNSGKWKVSQIETRTDCATTNGSNIYTMAGRTFTAADLWSLYEIAGAGAGGIALRGYVSAFTTHTVTLHTTSGNPVNAAATLSGLTASLKLATVDGAHGTNDLHETMSAGIVVNDILTP